MTGAIAFVRQEGPLSVIGLVDLGTGRGTDIVAVDGTVEDLDWAPDGDELAFGIGDRRGGVFVVGADGSRVRRIADGSQPAWSPDGTRIAYRASDGEIHVMGANGSHDRPMTDVGGASNPDWSPDGHAIAFVGPGPRGHDDGDDVYTANEDDSIVANLTSHPAVDADPAWFPTHGTIMFRTDRAMGDEGSSPRERLFVMNAEGGNLVRVTDDTSIARSPTWSPDGTRIAFDDGRSILVANADGSGITRVTAGVGAAWRPAVAASDASPTEAAPASTEPAAKHDLGLAFDVCDLTQATGAFDGTTQGTAWVVSKMADGGCPAPLNAPQVLAVDVDGDGIAELLVQTAQFSIAGLRLYDIRTDPPALVPVTVRPPGEGASLPASRRSSGTASTATTPRA